MLANLKRTVLQWIPPSVAGRLRSWQTHRLIKTFPIRTVEHRFGGQRLRITLTDPLAEGWYDHDWDDLPELAVLRERRLRPGGRVFDVGAHQSVVALMMAREVGPTGLVVAVEPNPHNCRAAARNRELNDVPQLVLIQAAVADQPGTVTFNERLNGQLDDGQGAAGRLIVEAMTIDGLADRFGMPDLVFLDVEGAEVMALAGATAVLSSDADFFVEVHVGYGLEKLGGTVERVLEYFPADRFRLMGRGETEPSFRPLPKGDPMTKDRFFLMALRQA